jgi:integrase
MSYHMIIRRGSTWHFRRAVPKALRAIVGQREIVKSLHTSDLQVAKSRAIAVAAEVDALLWRARRTLNNPEAAVAAVASNLVRQDTEWRRGTLLDDDDIEAQQLGILDELERLTAKPKGDLTSEVERLARIKALRAILAKLEDGNTAADAAPDQDDVTLSGLFERYKAERKPSEKVWREFDLVQRHCITVFGDLSVRSLTKSHIRSLKTHLLALPSSKRRQGQDEGATLSTSTVVKLLGLVRSVLAWGEREGFIDVNPAQGTARVASTEKKVATEADKRRPFTVEEVRALLAKLPTADATVRWILALCAFTGARLAEIVGLRQQDVGEEQGITYLDIRPHEGRSLKTKSSRRRVPLHSELVRLGFTRDALPFSPGSADFWSQKLGRWLRANGFEDARLVVHSFRHTVKDRLRAAGVEETVQRQLLGHAGEGVASSYGQGYPLETLARAVEAIRY